MVDKNIQDKLYQSNLKQENESYGFVWQFEDQTDEMRQNGVPIMNKFGSLPRSTPMFTEYNPLAINNHEYGNDTLNFHLPGQLQPALIHDPEHSFRNNSQLNLINDKQYISNQLPNQELSQNPQTKYPTQYELISNMKPMSTFQQQVQPYFPINAQQTQQTQQIRRPLPPDFVDEEPVYVNPKQYERIIKLRIKKAKKRLQRSEEANADKNGKSYKHESRHQHAKKRQRGTGGRFLSKAELAKLREQEEQEQLLNQDTQEQIQVPQDTHNGNSGQS